MDTVPIWTPVPRCPSCSGAVRKLDQELYMCNDCHSYIRIVGMRRHEKEMEAEVYTQEEWFNRLKKS